MLLGNQASTLGRIFDFKWTSRFVWLFNLELLTGLVRNKYYELGKYHVQFTSTNDTTSSLSRGGATNNNIY